MVTGAELTPLMLAVNTNDTEPLSISACVMGYADVQVSASVGSREVSRFPMVLTAGQVAVAPATVMVPVIPAEPVFLTSCLKLIFCPTVLYGTDVSANVFNWMITSWVLGVFAGKTERGSSVAGFKMPHDTRTKPMATKRASG